MNQPDFSTDDTTAALAAAQEAETSLVFADLGGFAAGLRLVAEACPSGPRELLQLDAHLCSLRLVGPSGEVFAGVYPLEGFESGNFPDSTRLYFEQRAVATSYPVARARYHEAIWTRWHDYKYAWAAQTQYLEIAQATDLEADGLVDVFDMPARAAQLALHLDHDREATGAILRSEIRRSVGLSTIGYPCAAAEHGAQLIALDRTDARGLIAEIEAMANSSREAGDLLRERGLLDACAQIAEGLNDKPLAREYQVRHAQSLEAQGHADKSGTRALFVLTEAAEEYKNLGLGDDAQRLKAHLIEASLKSEAEMVTISGQAEIPRAAFEATSQKLRAWDGEGPGPILSLPFELGIWRSMASLVAGQQKEDSHRIIWSLFRHVQIAHDGRNQPEPPNEASARLDSHISRTICGDASLSQVYLGFLREHGSWTVRRVAAALHVVDAELAGAILPGLRAFETGDHWTALHLFIPQLERLVRELGRTVGATVSSYTAENGLRWADMSEVLAQDKVRAAITEDLAKELEAVYLSRHGANLRNNFAHGALDRANIGNSESTVTLYAIFAVGLHLLVARGQARFEDAPTGA
jgi:hypothetical protein